MTTRADQMPSDAELQSQLEDLLGGLAEEDLAELVALAEAMHAEGGAQ